jgi:hypothetical protein
MAAFEKNLKLKNRQQLSRSLRWWKK